MRKIIRLFTAVPLVVLLFSGCSTDEKANPPGGKTGTAGSAGTTGTQITRTRITRLTPAAYFKVTIEMLEEQKKWSQDVNELLRKRRQAFFESFGLSEKKYRDYSMNNHAALQKYLRQNPWLDQKMNQLRSMYTQ